MADFELRMEARRLDRAFALESGVRRPLPAWKEGVVKEALRN